MYHQNSQTKRRNTTLPTTQINFKDREEIMRDILLGKGEVQYIRQRLAEEPAMKNYYQKCISRKEKRFDNGKSFQISQVRNFIKEGKVIITPRPDFQQFKITHG